MKKTLFSLAIAIGVVSCTAVKPYQKVNLNDPDMILADTKCDSNLLTAHAYREGSSGGNGGKTGGGCGCN